MTTTYYAVRNKVALSSYLLPTLCLAVGCLAALLTPATSHGQEWIASRSQHPWGRFPVGSWKQVAIKTEILDDAKKLVSTSTCRTTTTLVKANGACYTLKIEMSIQLGDKTFVTEPQYVQSSFLGEIGGELTSNTRLQSELMKISQSQQVSSEVRRVVYSGDDWTRISTVHYCPDRPPYIFQRTTETRDGSGNSRYLTRVRVTESNRLQHVMGQIRTVSQVQTQHRQDNTETKTVEYHCREVPGGVISYVSHRTDPGAKNLRRSTMTLVSYSGTPVDPAAVQVGQSTGRKPTRLSRKDNRKRRRRGRP